MADHGGHRTPSKPAPVSGPGALSRRTDGGVSHQAISAVPDQGYGEAKAQKDAQRIAPMAGQDPMAKPAVSAGGAGGGMPAYAGGDFAGPTQRPGEPITAGAPVGAGPGPEALTFQPQAQMPDGYITNLLAQLSPTDTTGTLGKLYVIAKQRGA